MADGVDEHGQVVRDTFRIDVTAWAHREVDAVEPHRLQRLAELTAVHPRQMLRKEAERTAEARIALRALSERQRVEGWRKPNSRSTGRGLNETAPAQLFHGCIL